jgi:hypothetical protein
MKLLTRETRPHNIERVAFKQGVPESVLEAWATFRQFAYIYAQTSPQFTPSLDVEAESFTAFVYEKGGVHAVEWLRKNKIVSRRIVNRFLEEVNP